MTPTRLEGTTKSTTSRKHTVAKAPANPLRRDLSSLVSDVRAALDELAVKGDLATMEGRDCLPEQVEEIENRWLRVKQELGLARSEADATLETLRAALSKAEDAVRHIFDAALDGVRKL